MTENATADARSCSHARIALKYDENNYVCTNLRWECPDCDLVLPVDAPPAFRASGIKAVEVDRK